MQNCYKKCICIRLLTFMLLNLFSKFAEYSEYCKYKVIKPLIYATLLKFANALERETKSWMKPRGVSRHKHSILN